MKKSMLSRAYFDKKISILKKHVAMPIFFFKFTLSKYCALMSFISIFLWKTSSCHPYDWLKNVNSVKTTLYNGPKNSIGCIFSNFTKKWVILWQYFVKTRPFSENQTVLIFIFYQKMPFLPKTLCSQVIFFKNFS